MKVSFFSPIFASHTPNSSEKWKFLRGTTQFFNFGQKAYTLLHFSERGKIALGEKIASKPTWFGIAMRVAALFTLVIPFVMLIGALIYKARNHFEISTRPSLLSIIPPEIQNIIVGFMGPSVLQFGATNKTHASIVNNALSLKAERVIPLLERSYALASNNPFILDKVAKGFSVIDLRRSMDIVMECIGLANAMVFDPRSFDVPNIYHTLALLSAKNDDEIATEAIASVWTLNNPIFRYEALRTVIQKLAETKPEKANEIAQRAIAEISAIAPDICKARCINIIMTVLPLLEPELALDLAEEALESTAALNNTDKYIAVASIAKALSTSHRERATEIIENAVLEANNLGDIIQKSIALVFLVEILAVLEPQRAGSIANTIPQSFYKSWALSFVVTAYAKEQPETAFALARGIPHEGVIPKALAFLGCIKAVAPQNPHNALVGFESCWWPSDNNFALGNNWPLAPGGYPLILKQEALIALAKGFALTDLPKAVSLVKGHYMATLELTRFLAASDPQKAYKWSSTLKNDLRGKAIIAKALLTSDPVKAKNLLVDGIKKDWHGCFFHEVMDVVMMIEPNLVMESIKKLQGETAKATKAHAFADFAYRYLAM